MKVAFGEGKTRFGPGVSIEMTGDELALAIELWLLSQGVRISGPRTTTVNGERCECANVYVDPSGFVTHCGERYEGRGIKVL